MFRTVKSDFAGDIRRISIIETESLEGLKRIMAKLYNLGDNEFSIRYADEDGDLISIQSDDELRELLNPSKPSSAILRLAISLIRVGEKTKEEKKEKQKAEEEESVTYTQTPFQQQVFQNATSSFETLLQTSLLELFKRSDFQEKILSLVKETITSKAFSEIVQTLLPQVSMRNATTQAVEPPKDINPLLEEALKEANSVEETVEKLVVETPVIVPEEIVPEEPSKTEVTSTEPEESIAATPSVEKEEEKKETPKEVVVEPEITFIPEPPVEKSKGDSPKQNKKTLIPSFITSVLGLGGGEPKPKPDYTEQLRTLADMGFVDKEHNIKLLDKYKGSVEQCLERLLNS